MLANEAASDVQAPIVGGEGLRLAPYKLDVGREACRVGCSEMLLRVSQDFFSKPDFVKLSLLESFKIYLMHLLWRWTPKGLPVIVP